MQPRTRLNSTFTATTDFTMTFFRTTALVLSLAVALGTPGNAAAQTAESVSTAAASGRAAASVAAHRADAAPVLDGRDNDAVWQAAPLTDAFRESRPREDGDPSQRTSFRVAYDAENLYVFVRAYDTHPDSIIPRLARRDQVPPSDHVIIIIDSYRDRRSGFQFLVNSAGVKADYALSNDGNEDSAWDGVWDVATRMDSAGWTAEYRIPFSQLKFAPQDEVTFGFMVWRNLQRETKILSWPVHRQSRTGFVSQMGDLTGLRGLASPKRAEISPYVLAQSEPSPGTFDRSQRLSVGGDIRYRMASNVTLNATVNPDFGQVEADPGQLNLTAFETFFGERRPFFIEGAGLFDFRVNCFIVVDCQTGEGLFYSRRIGRSPDLRGTNGDATTPTSTRILGAAKVTGRLPGGFSVGFFDAVTEEVKGTTGRTAEPFANYAVLRGNQDFDGGTGSVGLMLTSTNRRLDESSEAFLHANAFSGGLDARRRLGRFELSGALMGSHVAGTAEAIARTQRRATHYYQRPDDNVEFDPTRTSLSGSALELRFGKVGGERTRFEFGYARRSPGFEINDIGFLNRADEQSFTWWGALRWNTPKSIYQRINWNFNFWNYWSLEGLPTDRAFNSNIHVQFNNRMWLHAGTTMGLGDVYCDRNCTRGGPAVRVGPAYRPNIGIEGDNRRTVVPSIFFNYGYADGGRSTSWGVSPQVTVRPSSRFSTSFAVNANYNVRDNQWYGNFPVAGGGTDYTFAELDQSTIGVTWRLNYTFTPTMSFQWYANPFLTKGTYSRVRELDNPRATAYDDRYRPYDNADVVANPGGFNVKQFRSNAVFRWEYRPGSTLFLVWNQGRQQQAGEEGDQAFGRELGDLFERRAEDRFLVKVSYWLNR